MATHRRGRTPSGIARHSPGASALRGAAVACAVVVGLTACSGGGSDAAAGTPTGPSSAAQPTASDTAAASSVSAASPPAPAPVTAPATPPAPAPAPPPAARSMTVTATDFAFQLPSSEIPAGTWTITLTDRGRATHDLVAEQDGRDIARTDRVGPGGSTTLTITLDPGRYVFYCSVGNHRAMGMEVAVTVT